MDTLFQTLRNSTDVKNVQGTKIFKSSQPGPTAGLLCMTHGNERAGLQCISRLLSTLQNLTRGRVIVTCNNILATEQNKRFLEEDMNRVFSPQRRIADSLEARRVRELLPVFDQMDIAIDLHSVITTPNPPSFTVIPGGTDSQIQLARQIDVPYHVLYPRYVNGTGSTSDYFVEKGKACLTLEAGFEPEIDIEKLTLNVRRYLKYAGVLDAEIPPPQQDGVFLELSQMEYVKNPASFQYASTFKRRAFRPIQKDELIATDEDGYEYRSQDDSYLLFSRPADSYKSLTLPVSEPFIYLLRKIV